MTQVAHPEDVLPVRSRISWGAIFAGLFVALASNILLSLLGAALGLTISNRTSAEQLGNGAAVWAVVSALISLFGGGFVVSFCTAGESKVEAVFYGTILWALMFVLLAWAAATSVRLGFTGLIGLAATNGQTVEPAASQAQMEDQARKAGFNESQIQWLRQNWSNEARHLANDPEARRSAATAAWWSLAGAVLSLICACAGALCGAGPDPFFRMRLVRRPVHGTATAPPAQ